MQIGSLYQAKSVENIPNAQDGGAATALLGYALRKGIIKCALVAGKDSSWNTFSVIVTDASDLIKYTGSIYFPLDSKDIRSKVKKSVDAKTDIGVVVTPCQLRILGVGSNAVKPEQIKLKIGLFCLGSFNPEKFWSYVGNEVKREDVKRFEIDTELRLIDGEGRTVFRSPVREAHKYSIPWCNKCHEFIPAAADLSVGAGPEKGSCAVYIQTKRGLKIFEGAHDEGVLSVADVSDRFREKFEKTARAKKGKVI